MKSFLKYTLMGVMLSLSTLHMKATDLTISLTGSDPITRNTAKHQCDARAGSLGVPTGFFPMEYLNGNGNNLAVLPIKGHSLIFASVLSASGARYANQYIWWEAGARHSPLCQPRFTRQQAADFLPANARASFLSSTTYVVNLSNLAM